MRQAQQGQGQPTNRGSYSSPQNSINYGRTDVRRPPPGNFQPQRSFPTGHIRTSTQSPGPRGRNFQGRGVNPGYSGPKRPSSISVMRQKFYVPPEVSQIENQMLESGIAENNFADYVDIDQRSQAKTWPMARNMLIAQKMQGEESEFVIPVKINGMTFEALVDTGAIPSAVSPQVVKKLQLKAERFEGNYLRMADSSLQMLKERVFLKIEVKIQNEKRIYGQYFVVFPGL